MKLTAQQLIVIAEWFEEDAGSVTSDPLDQHTSALVCARLARELAGARLVGTKEDREIMITKLGTAVVK